MHPHPRSVSHVALVVAVLTILAMTAAVRSPADPTVASASAPTLRTPGGQRVLFSGGTTDTNNLVLWAFGRFGAAGLAEPTADLVEIAGDTARCDDHLGLAVMGADNGEIRICLLLPNACPLDRLTAATELWRRCAVHELAHLWIDENVSTATRRTFMAATGSPAWADAALPWHRRGVEQAAQALTWGLLDGRGYAGSGQLCEQRWTGFVILTGIAPDIDCEAPTWPGVLSLR